jgi:protein TonB
MKHKRLLKYLPALGGLGVIILVAILVYVFRELFDKPAQSKKQVQQISVVQPPTPPPPPPKPEIKPPEVKEEKMPDPETEPEPEPEAPEPDQEPAEAPGDQLGVDAEGGAGSDGFGLVGKKGGSGLIGGGGGNAIIWYGQHVQRELTDELHKTLRDRARQTKYTAVLHVWIKPDGNIDRVELVNSSGTAEIDEALKLAISQVRGRFKPPPERMPQPLKIRIRS